MAENRIIIIGAGMTGLLLAQALKTCHIAFDIYESDPKEDFRGQGWGLAIHWALDSLRSLLPEELRTRLRETYVDPELGEGCGRFPLFRLDTGQELYENLSDQRVRVSRERFRNLLMSGIHIQWGKKLEEITQQEDRSIRVTFTDGSSAGGTFLAGCDGSGSKVKEILCDLGGSDSRNRTMPVRFLGASADLRGEVVSWLRNLDPLFFQGTHPNNSFMFFGIQDTPATVKGASADTYRCQINISWPYREGFLGQGSPIEVPDTKEQQLSLMKTIAGHWKSPFKDAVDSISGDAPIRAVKIVEYVPVFGAWDNLGGRATLVGDAAHAMTMYRGEAANHSIKDVESLVHCIKTHPDLKIACLSFEKEMIDRTSVAVKASSQACRDAHEHARIDKESLLISKRAIVPGKSVE